MERFQDNGHLTDEALRALIEERELDELARLEIAEHLAFCDRCLQRYTELLSDSALRTPPDSCHAGIWRRIRMRTFRLLSSRYATAAAAVALALTLLWGAALFRNPSSDGPAQNLQTVTQHLQSWPERWSDTLGNAFSQLGRLFDFFDTGADAPQSTQQGDLPS